MIDKPPRSKELTNEVVWSDLAFGATERGHPDPVGRTSDLLSDVLDEHRHACSWTIGKRVSQAGGPAGSARLDHLHVVMHRATRSTCGDHRSAPGPERRARPAKASMTFSLSEAPSGSIGPHRVSASKSSQPEFRQPPRPALRRGPSDVHPAEEGVCYWLTRLNRHHGDTPRSQRNRGIRFGDSGRGPAKLVWVFVSLRSFIDARP